MLHDHERKEPLIVSPCSTSSLSMDVGTSPMSLVGIQ